MTGRDDASSSSDGDRCVKVYLPEGYSSWGHHQFVKQSDLESLVTNGWATIMCVVIVVRDDPLDVPPSDIGSHLGHLLDCPDTSDVPCSSGRPRRPLAGLQSTALWLHGRCQDVVHLMYTDAFPADDELGCSSAEEKLQDLLAAADRYALDRLKLLCASKLWDSVSVDTVATTLACAETYNCPELKKKCIGFVAEEKNFKKAVLTDGFVQLVQKSRSILARDIY
ncbi:hypothetical protein BAE44_0014259 [Dichanthelium oligosanthes]|uniref:BPM/SPOP BACK domain-containing protein n=1 Tax=Dichanthelium oligosanthes TaxID=888268 RepID=A0A1E5VHY1_9POAL|nr:hypothetical protein BAE44_0014259 [Dichanthelium oligosanthes]